METQRNAHLLILLFLFFIVAICAYRYYDYVISQNYVVVANTACDPMLEQCFKSSCDSQDPGCDTGPYEKVQMNASTAPKCLLEHTCVNFSCVGSSCTITYCSDQTKEDGEECVTGSDTAQ